jgi:sulfoxide reductase heme-binding subunit YedZ
VARSAPQRVDASGKSASGLSKTEAIVKRWIRPALWLLVIVPLVLLTWRAVQGDLGANPIEKLEGETGRWTLRFLAASLAVTPLISVTRWGWLIPQRRFLGLSAFTYACIHLSIYIGVDNFFDVDDIVKDVLKNLWVTLGMAAFLMLLPLAITSTKASIKRLGGKRWNRLHQLVYPAAVAGCVHFLWAVKKDKTEPLIYLVIFAGLFALRLRNTRRTKSPAQGAPAPAA